MLRSPLSFSSTEDPIIQGSRAQTVAWGWGATVSPQLQRTSSATWTRWKQVGTQPSNICSVFPFLDCLLGYCDPQIQWETNPEHRMPAKSPLNPQALLLQSRLLRVYANMASYQRGLFKPTPILLVLPFPLNHSVLTWSGGDCAVPPL